MMSTQGFQRACFLHSVRGSEIRCQTNTASFLKHMRLIFGYYQFAMSAILEKLFTTTIITLAIMLLAWWQFTPLISFFINSVPYHSLFQHAQQGFRLSQDKCCRSVHGLELDAGVRLHHCGRWLSWRHRCQQALEAQHRLAARSTGVDVKLRMNRCPTTHALCRMNERMNELQSFSIYTIAAAAITPVNVYSYTFSEFEFTAFAFSCSQSA